VGIDVTEEGADSIPELGCSIYLFTVGNCERIPDNPEGFSENIYISIKESPGAGVEKTKNNSGASPFFSGASIIFLQIRAKKTMNQTKIKLHIVTCTLIYDRC
jgi:hypothetical protein